MEGGEDDVDAGREGGMDGGGGGSITRRVFGRGSTGESAAVGVEGARFCARSRSVGNGECGGCRSGGGEAASAAVAVMAEPTAGICGGSCRCSAANDVASWRHWKNRLLTR